MIFIQSERVQQGTTNQPMGLYILYQRAHRVWNMHRYHTCQPVDQSSTHPFICFPFFHPPFSFPSTDSSIRKSIDLPDPILSHPIPPTCSLDSPSVSPLVCCPSLLYSLLVYFARWVYAIESTSTASILLQFVLCKANLRNLPCCTVVRIWSHVTSCLMYSNLLVPIPFHFCFLWMQIFVQCKAIAAQSNCKLFADAFGI